MKKYLIPTLEVTVLAMEDVLTLSGESSHLRAIIGDAVAGGSSTVNEEFWG